MSEQVAARRASPFVMALRDLFDENWFRTGLLIFDVLTVLLFIVLTFMPLTPAVIAVDAFIGTLMLVEFIGRVLVSHHRRRYLLQPAQLLDLAVIVTLFVPTITGSFAFLRILRAVRLFRTIRVIRELRRKHPWLAERGELIQSASNLVVFVFITSAVVYELQVGHNPKITSFVQALYFTVATLTTTGFGDITLVGDAGHLLSVVIMIIGISLFLKLAQSIVRPSKVHVECQQCGLSRHDPDAVHCKHCGAIVHIDTEGG